MKFAFIVHPLSQHASVILNADEGGVLRDSLNGDPLQFCDSVSEMLSRIRKGAGEA